MELNYKNFVAMAIAMTLCFSSCSDKEDTPVPEQPKDAIEVLQSDVTAFSASISATFYGITKPDIALGKHGVMYCLKRDDAESVFMSWVEGNNKPDCMMFTGGSFSDESYTGKIEGLSAETEYSYCLFSQDMSNTVREISAVYTLKTGSFNPVFNDTRVEQIHFTDAAAYAKIVVDKADLASCTLGMLVSETQGCKADSTSWFCEFSGKYQDKIKILMTGIQPDKHYYCRPAVRYHGQGGSIAYASGDEVEFSALPSSSMYVDLGLPSGIKWAKCDLGNYEIGNKIDSTLYMWGSLTPIQHPEDYKEQEWYQKRYQYWDAANRSCTDIGIDISGTEYDVAHKVLGGKWRMPTKEDVEELIQNCNAKNCVTGYYPFFYDGYDATLVVPIGIVSGPNGNSIRLEETIGGYWCGTLSSDISEYAYTFYYYAEYLSSESYGNGRIELFTTYRYRPQQIRPVWDDKME